MADKEQPTPTIVQQLMKDVSDNPVNIKWPRDQWGNTTGIKKELLKAASNIRGNADKHDVLLNTLAVAIAHVQKRRAKDVAYVKASREIKIAAEQERAPRQRVSASVIPTE